MPTDPTANAEPAETHHKVVGADDSDHTTTQTNTRNSLTDLDSHPPPPRTEGTVRKADYLSGHVEFS